MRNRILIAIFAAFFFIAGPAFAETPDGRDRPKDTKPPAADVAVEISSKKPGGEPKAEVVRVSACPKYAVSRSVSYVNSTSTDDTTPQYGYIDYTCDGINWTRIWGCTSNCPPGVEPLTDPPNPRDIEDSFAESAPLPAGYFAPPVHEPGIAAITGLRLYASVTPQTSNPFRSEYASAGRWYAYATLTSTAMSLTFDGQTKPCTIFPPPNPGNAEGRDASDCWLPVTHVPDNDTKTAPVTLTVTWTIDIESNVPGIAETFTVDKTTTTDITIKQLQAVVTE